MHSKWNSVKNQKRIKIGISWVRLTSQGSDDFPLTGKKKQHLPLKVLMEAKLEKMKFIPQLIRLTEAGKYESMLKKYVESL